MNGFSIVYATFFFWVALVAGVSTAPTQPPATAPVKGQLTSHGCYGSLTSSANGMSSVFLSSASCWNDCQERGKSVMITHLETCFCADTYPPLLSRVDDDQCDYPCPGYAAEACGGENAYSVFNVGIELDVDNDDASVSSSITSAAASTSIASSTVSSASAATNIVNSTASSASASTHIANSTASSASASTHIANSTSSSDSSSTTVSSTASTPSVSTITSSVSRSTLTDGFNYKAMGILAISIQIFLNNI
ncbi:hypothetical protein B0J13DRAFT_127749 [Dactylonectria estremocensis]|uniref:WSC domain-containing protein n=1 Tax=Dactylonectria estremocensis TaxID=1079267 RepID=A0A9P9FEI0_9HYPO|nr:hypothetical protein B0J13DRAFT_127749 [Dactylonectria estremocensis]